MSASPSNSAMSVNKTPNEYTVRPEVRLLDRLAAELSANLDRMSSLTTALQTIGDGLLGPLNLPSGIGPATLAEEPQGKLEHLADITVNIERQLHEMGEAVQRLKEL